jgi:serine/threonine-protein kinase
MTGADDAGLEMTRTTELLGTPLYMSPEQMRSTRNVDARTDIWSLGAILYRMLTGKTPFTGSTVTEICSAVIADAPDPPSAARSDLPPGLEAVILRCLEKVAAKRFATAAELATALAPFATAVPSATATGSVSGVLPPNVVGESSQTHRASAMHSHANAALGKPDPSWTGSGGAAPPEVRARLSQPTLGHGTAVGASWTQGGQAPRKAPALAIAIAMLGTLAALTLGVFLGWRALHPHVEPAPGESHTQAAASPTAPPSASAVPQVAPGTPDPAPTPVASSSAPTARVTPVPHAPHGANPPKSPKPDPFGAKRSD